ncbi:MAG: formyltransferase family protein [Bullifex sp.]
MKLFICGQRSFGREVLKALYERGHEIVGVAPPPQDKLYDKMQVLAVKLGLPVVSDCDKLTSRDIPDDTDLVIAAHSHWYISDKIRKKAKYGAIGFHPSLLPRHRGQDAVRWTVAMNDAITGGTVFWLNETVDGGPILSQRVVFVDKAWDYHELWKHLFPIGVEMLCEAVDLIEKGSAPRVDQNKRFATWEPSFQTVRLKRNELIQLGG